MLSSFYEQYWTFFFFPFSSSHTYQNLLWVELFSFNFIFSFIILVLFKGSSQYVVIYGPVQRSLRRVLPDLLMCTLPVRRRQWHPTPVLLPGKSHGPRSLVGCSPWGRYQSDTTERLHFHFSLSCIGEGNGNPLQCSCLENPRDGGASWAAVSGVTQSQTRLKRLSSSSSSTLPVKSWFVIGCKSCFLTQV